MQSILDLILHMDIRTQTPHANEWYECNDCTEKYCSVSATM